MTNGTSQLSSCSLNFLGSVRMDVSMSASAPAVAKSTEERQASAWGLLVSPEKRTLSVALLLFAVVVIAYSPIGHNGFINFDDGTYIATNPHIRTGLSVPAVKWAFTTFEAGHYHPLTWLSHELDCQLFGLNPAAHHEVNVLLHAANAVLLFLLLQTATGFPVRSLFVAALFALHPINVESVAWAAERKNVLSMLFLLLALHAYIRYVRQPRLDRYALVVLLFALGLLSKSQIITLPFLLFLFDYWPLNRFKSAPAGSMSTLDSGGLEIPTPPRVSVRRLILEKLPLLALSAAIAFITMKTQRAGGAVQSLASPLLRLETAVISYAHYLGKAFWPTNLVLLYPQPTQLYPVGKVCGAALLLAFITAVALCGRQRRYLATGWLWFLGALVPMIGLVRVGAQAMPDHFAYLPFLGLFLMLIWLVADLAKKVRIPTAWLTFAGVAVLLALGGLTYRQLGYWRDSESVWTHTLALTENNSVAQDMLGNYLSDEGRPDEAAVHFHAALAILPGDLLANLGLGAYEQTRGNLPAAIEHYQVVARHAAQPILRADAYANMGSVYRQLGDLVKAKQSFETSNQLAPDQPMPLVGLGLVAQRNGDFDEAIREYSRAMAIRPTDVGYLLIASALADQGHPADANAIAERVARFSRDLGAAKKEARALLGR